MLTWQRLTLTPDDAPCLHAPGLPRALFTDGQRLGWLDSGGLFAVAGSAVFFLPLPGVEDLCASEAQWVARADGHLYWGRPGEGAWHHRPSPPGTLCLGSHWVVWAHGATHGALVLSSGEAISLPHTASRARPWPDRAGACWISAGTLYTMTADGRVSAVDAVGGAVHHWCVGPGQSVLVELKDGRVYASVGGRLLVQLDSGAQVAESCFRSDGHQALLRTEEGCGLYDLLSGARLGTYEGVAPVGLSPQTALLEEDTGELLSPDGDLLFPCFLGGPSVLSDDLLVGPGAAGWDLSTGEARFSGPALAAQQILASEDTIWCLHEDEICILDRETGAELKWAPRPSGQPMVARGALLFTEEEEYLPADPTTTEEHALGGLPDALGLAVTNETVVGGRRWMWNDEGLLVSLPSPSVG